MNKLLGPMRLPFLVLTPACCALGYALAKLDGFQPGAVEMTLVLIGAISAHISVNAFNEYEDFVSGLDLKTEPTPFSGGSGTLPQHPELSSATLALAIVTLSLVLLIGSYFVWSKGIVMLPFGILGVVVILSYTRYLTRVPWLSLVAAGFAFGPLMVGGTYVALTGSLNGQVLLVSLIPFFLANNLLLLNQYPDIAADRETGRRNLAIVYGLHRANQVYLIFSLSAFCSLYLVTRSIGYSVLGFAGLALILPLLVGLFRHEKNLKRLIPYLGLNVVISVLTPVLISIGMLLEAS